MLGQYRTSISKSNLDQIRNRAMTPSEMIDFLEEGALYRSFTDVLRSVYPGEDLAERLRTQLCSFSAEPPDKKEMDALRKNISNWLRGNVVPQNREQIFKICFALGLTEAQASWVLASTAETGIHYRSPKELVYAFALRTARSYPEAVALDREMAEIYGPIVEAAEAERIARWKKKEKIYHETRAEAHRIQQQREKRGLEAEPYLGVTELDDPPSFYTQRVAHQFEKVTTVEQLRSFFLQHSADLGVIHESAYEKFWRLLLVLQEPDDSIVYPSQEDAFYSLDKIAQTYFRMHVPVDKKTAGYDYLQKAVKKNWPGTSELQKMKARKIDVSRKALLLLFLITEDFLFSDDLQYSDQSEEDAAWFLPQEDESPRDQLEIVLSKINLFLVTYGMNQLDPGSPFDCLVLYALAATYEGEFLSDKFSCALRALFAEETADPQ